MRKRIWILLFFIALLINIVSGETGNEWVQYVSKIALMPLLFFLFANNQTFSFSKSRFIAAALFFSWAGDVLLLFQAKDSLFFMLGLSAFLLAHVFYILFFLNILKPEAIKIKPILVIAVVSYYLALVSILFSHLGNMKIPVLVYGVVISTMLLLALHLLFIKKREAGWWMLTGAVLFVLSDSILAVNKFYHPFTGSSAAIMITYGLAQFCIIKGAIKYLCASE